MLFGPDQVSWKLKSILSGILAFFIILIKFQLFSHFYSCYNWICGYKNIISQFPPKLVRVKFRNSGRKWCECANFARGMHMGPDHTRRTRQAHTRLSSHNIFHRTVWLEAIDADRNLCATAAAVNRSALRSLVLCVYYKFPSSWCLHQRARIQSAQQVTDSSFYAPSKRATTTFFTDFYQPPPPECEKCGGRERGFYRNCHRNCAASVLMRWLIASASLQAPFLVAAIFRQHIYSVCVFGQKGSLQVSSF